MGWGLSAFIPQNRSFNQISRFTHFCRKIPKEEDIEADHLLFEDVLELLVSICQEDHFAPKHSFIPNDNDDDDKH